MIIDFHTHLGEDKDGSKQTLAELETNMRHYGISHAVIFPFNDKNSNVETASIKLSKFSSKTIIPFIRFDPKNMAPERLTKLLNTNKFHGVKLHPRAEEFDPLDEKYFALYQIIEKQKIPILFHTRKENLKTTDPDRIAELAKKFPNLNIVLAHFAMASSVAIEQIKNAPNLYLDSSVVSSPRLIEMVVKSIGTDKLLFASDAPYSDQEIELLKIKKANLPEKDKEKILYGNAAKLLNLANFNKNQEV